MTTIENVENYNVRGFSPAYTVLRRPPQRDRFGQRHRRAIRDMLERNDNEEYPDGFTGRWDDFPRVSRLRMNLTALSRVYDLYFVAYRGWVYVYTQLNRGCGLILKDNDPILMLDPAASATPMSEFTDGHVNKLCPHDINQLVVGDLGDEEVLVLVRDNGDVAAWYTKLIARHVESIMRRERHPDAQVRDNNGTSLSPPRHFFVDNVGMSAWGVAVHKKSRLIAVSANTREVTVFAFALSGDEANKQFEKWTMHRDPFAKPSMAVHKPQRPAEYLIRTAFSTDRNATDYVPGSTTMDKKTMDKHILELQRAFHTRKRTWRIVIPFGVEASNLPSVSFLEDETGNANRIAAIDINGCLFIADIWTIGTRPVKIPPHNVQTPVGLSFAEVQGWNLLPVTDAQLLQTESIRAAIGLHPSKALHRNKTNRGTWTDISKCMAEVYHDTDGREHRRRIALFQSDMDISKETDGLVRPSAVPVSVFCMSQKIQDPIHDTADVTDLGSQGPTQVAMAIVPSTGDYYTEFSDSAALVNFAGATGAQQRMLAAPMTLTLHNFREQNAYSPEVARLLHGVSFLRTNREDVELRSLDDGQDGDCSVVCHHVLAYAPPSGSRPVWDMQLTGQRASMLLTIPELNLVVLGSLCGRVALITLTKPPLVPQKRSGLRKVPRRAFRVDAVLPFDCDDEAGDRPGVCLLGIAVSPVPETRTRGLELRRRRPCAHGGRRAETVREMEPEAPRRWRLLLNYQDHTILHYEIIRREDGEDGSWGDFLHPGERKNEPDESDTSQTSSFSSEE